MLIPALVVLLAVPVVMWLFPEQVGNHNHYDGNFGDTDQTLPPLDSLTDAEHNKMAAWWGYCEGDETK